jgi:hypothetical protein
MFESRLRMVRVGLLSYSSLVLTASCGQSHSRDYGSETNWLRGCRRATDCGQGDCVCSVCSAECDLDKDCPSGLRCAHASSQLYAQTCGIDLNVKGLCAPTCTRDSQCGPEQQCNGGACTPPGGATGADAGDRSTGPARQLAVDAHLDLTPACTADLEHPLGSGAAM